MKRTFQKDRHRMNQNDFRPIAEEVMEIDTVYRLQSKTFDILARFLGEDQFEITQGVIRSQTDKKKSWGPGKTIKPPVGTKFYRIVGEPE